MQTRTMTQRLIPALVVTLVAPGIAHAHFNLTTPPAADNATDGGKGAPPCGPTTPSNIVTPAMGGHPLSVMLTETVGHPGHYRFALSINSRAELPTDPVAVVANGLSVSAPVENPAVFPVLADGVFDHATPINGMMFQTTVTLPNVTCTKCTLQVIEFMAQHGLNPGGGFYYHHCADLAITADPTLPPADLGGTGGSAGAGSGGTTGGGTDAGTDAGKTTTSGGGGCTLAGGRARASAGAAGALLGLGLVLGLRRRRRR